MERFSKIPVHVEAGDHEVAVAFIDRSHVASDENFQHLEPYNGLTGGAAALNGRAELRDAVEIVGPVTPRAFRKQVAAHSSLHASPSPRNGP